MPSSPTPTLNIISGDAASDLHRLAVLKATRDCVTYHDAPMVEDRTWNLSLYGNCQTGELFVALTQGTVKRVHGFRSSSLELTAEERAQGIVWPDLVEAFAQARELHRGALEGGGAP